MASPSLSTSFHAEEKSIIFDLLEEECGGGEHLPSWLTAEAFYDPAVMLLLAVLA